MNFEHIILVYIIPVVIWIAVISVTLRLLIRKQAVSVTLAWLMMIYLLPVVGVLAYLILGEVNLGSRRANAFRMLHPKYLNWLSRLSEERPLISALQDLQFSPVFNLAYRRLGIPCVCGNELHILDTPDSIIDSIINDIKQAKHSVHMLFYIWAEAGRVEEVASALKEAVDRGVKVKILLDSVGSKHFLKSVACRAMKANGIAIIEALHVNLLRMFFSRIDLRQHRKIVVIDNQIAYTGSMNMVDPKYFKQDSDVGEWVDMMVRINGPVSPVLNSLFAWDWEIETRQEILPTLPAVQPPSVDDNDTHSVQIIGSGPAFPNDLVAQTLACAIFSARESIVITSPYFVPSHNIAEALQIAALRGVDVSLIVPYKNDSLMVHWASCTFFDDLLDAGVKIYGFKAGLLHTKSVLIDNRLALVGTVNMDLRSFLLNFEVMMAVEDRAFANEVSLLHDNYLQKSERLDPAIWSKRPFYHRIIEKLFFFFSPLL